MSTLDFTTGTPIRAIVREGDAAVGSLARVSPCLPVLTDSSIKTACVALGASTLDSQEER